MQNAFFGGSGLSVVYEKNTEAIKKAMLTDGIWMLVTNICETTEPAEYRLGPRNLSRHTGIKIG
ncbi:MAG: hypothetical protein C4B59_01775 [Candidatus Methanogaster sp.]|uniref:Uncharacterized protein n=1 Tax=Candidatus Methanogaster sp. TaxID=3386292 RepID=A0AC61L6B8_9EURY|nr:MAG: hypothetical protein C4B59_01775 [ANME-2 cluster archaeon]